MEKRENGFNRLLIIVLILCASVLFIHKNKHVVSLATHIDVLDITTDAIGSLSCDAAYEHMRSLLMSHDVDLTVKIVTQFIHHCAVELVEKMIRDTTTVLTAKEKMEIIFGTVAQCNCKRVVQYRLLDFLLEYPSLYEKTPALLVLACSKYSDGIPVFINWGKDRQKNLERDDIISRFVNHAFEVAIEHDDYTATEIMLSKKVRLAHDKASDLLWYVVKHNKNNAFVPLLVHHAQADINYACEGKTVLIEAVEQDNTPMVQALLDEGAIVDRVVDVQKGNALRIAIAHKYYATEQLLREYGA